MSTVTFNKETLKKLKQQYNKAVKNKQKTFTFETNQLLTAYAKYLIEYLEDTLA